MEIGRGRQPALPYVMYRGVVTLGLRKRKGFGLMLAQPCITWNLELLRPAIPGESP
jgi:hypothetical protein